jgi:hypothetical protein
MPGLPIVGNFALSRFVTPPSGTGGLSFTVTASEGAKFPSPAAGRHFYGICATPAQTTFEVVRVTARSSDTFTLDGRGLDGSTAQTWNVGDLFYYPMSKIMLEELLNPSIITLTDAATVSWDASLSNVFRLTLNTAGANRAVGAPSNLRVGTYILEVIQDGSGNRTITWNAAFKWPAGVAPVLSTSAGAKDIISFYCDGTNMIGSYIRGVA